MRLTFVAVMICAAVPAAADTDGLPRPPKPLRVEARLDGDTARFAVRYLVHAAKTTSDYATQYELPARGLVTAATVTEGGQRHVMDLMAAEKASTAFNGLWEKAPARARTWAVLLENEPYQNSFAILSAVPRQATLAVDVEISAATCFHRDARYVKVPTEWLARVPAAMQIGEREAAAVDDTCTNETHESSDMAWLKLRSPALASRHGGADRIGTYANRAMLGKTSVVKLEVDLAAKLSEVPADLATVILIDASRSTTREELEAQRHTASAYLRAAPNARVQVIEYARHPRALLPSWTTASQAAPRVERALQAMQRKNGSNIAAAVREAAKWLEQTSGTRRIVLFTDENLTTRDEHTHVIDDALPANTLVHVVALGGAGLARDDSAKLARIARKTRGMSVRGGELMADDDKSAQLDATMLVRPISLDHVRVRTPGWQALDSADGVRCPETEDDFASSLAEGTSCTWWGQGDAVSSPFVVEGLLWGERVERVLRADLARSLDVVRELSAMHVLGEELQKLADRAARALNEVWSFYATWGGDGGYDDGYGMGRAGFGISCGSCSVHDVGIGSGTGSLGPRVDLATELARIAQTCKPAQAVDIEVETTLEEIVDVEAKGATPALRTCVEEALWNAWLVAPGSPPRIITRVTVQPS